MDRCFVTGATGYVGRAVVEQLAERGPRTRVIAHVRPDSPRLTEWRERFAALGAEVDVSAWEVAGLAAALRRHAVSHLLVLIGTTRARAQGEGIEGDRYQQIDLGLTRIAVEAAIAAGARPRLIYLSSIGADPGARSRYLRARGEAEAVVAGAGLSYLVARPALISGPDREEQRAGERALAVLGDGVLAGLAAVGLGGPRRRWGSLDAGRLARALIVHGIDGLATGVVEGAELRAAV